MQFGLFFPHQLPRPWTAEREHALFQASLEQVELADRLGYDYAWAQEHHFLEEYSHSSAPEVLLAAFSQRTRQIRLGHGVVLMVPAYNHPARVVERIATLDLLSNGRVEWGTGESASRIELEGFGVSFLEKRAMWQEAVQQAALMMATDPYPGHRGAHFELPVRNVVPKPLQRPHPPMWVACSNRESVRHAARMGLGALTFAFMNADEARFWVREYYETFESECTPIGRTVNPRLAMLTDFMVHEDADEARRRGLDGARFFAWGLSHYYRTGTHVPGRTDLWRAFADSPPVPHAGVGGIGSPAKVREAFEAFEEAGVDQLILLHQAGNYDAGHVTRSLGLFGEEVLPAFRARHARRRAEQAEALEPAIRRALARIPELPSVEPSPVESFPVLAERRGVDLAAVTRDRAVLPGALWRLHTSGAPRRRDDLPE